MEIGLLLFAEIPMCVLEEYNHLHATGPASEIPMCELEEYNHLHATGPASVFQCLGWRKVGVNYIAHK